jgi:hypothetical protein
VVSTSSMETSKAFRKKRLWWMLAAIAFVLFCRLVLLRKRRPQS